MLITRYNSRNWRESNDLEWNKHVQEAEEVERSVHQDTEQDVDNQLSVAILLSIGCESYDAVHSLHKRRFSQV